MNIIDFFKPRFNIIAGVNGTGKSSLRGVIVDYVELGIIVDPDLIAKENGTKEKRLSDVEAGKIAIKRIDDCLCSFSTFTRETTLSGHRIVKELRQAKEAGFNVSMFYVGLETVEDSLERIANRVKKGDHDIPEDVVRRRYDKRFEDFMKCVPFCDEIIFYDNDNGFKRIAIYDREFGFRYTNGERPEWIKPIETALKQL